MKRFHVRLLLCLGLTLSLGAAQAADLDYDWLSAGAIQEDPSGGNSLHGWYVDGSYAVASQFTLQGTYYKLDVDVSNCHLAVSCSLFSEHADSTRLGAGWHVSVADSTDLLMDAYYTRDEDRRQFTSERFGVGTCFTGEVTIPGGCADISGFDDKGNGYQLDLGIRARCDCNLEFKGYLGYLHAANIGSKSFVSGEGAWNFLDSMALVLELRRLPSSVNQYRLGLRYLF